MKSLYPILFTLSLLPNLLAYSNIIFVNPFSTNTPDGTDWQHAFHDLQEALAIAEQADTIWVAAATYYPTIGNDRHISFIIPNGVVLLGGFSGTENSIEERDWEDHPTVLSGNIGDINDSTDNSFHILLLADTDSTTVVDGFIIRNGYAIDPTSDTSEPENKGGGMYVVASNDFLYFNPVLRNCTFEYNIAKNGGAVYCDKYNINIDFENVQFLFNRAIQYAGAYYKIGGNYINSFRLDSCYFKRNVSTFGGGAIYHYNPIGDINITHTTFDNDSCLTNGGAIFWEAENETAIFTIYHSTFIGNIGADGGALSFLFIGNGFDSEYTLDIKNSNFISNKSINNVGGGIAFFGGNNTTIYVEDCLFDSNMAFNGGPGVYISDASQNDHISCFFNNNKFINNSTHGGVGALSFRLISDFVTLDAQIMNSTFSKNKGAIVLLSGSNGAVESEIINCTFFSNGNYPILKNWNPAFDYVNFYNTCYISNSVFWENTPVYKMFYNNDYEDYTIHDYYIDHSIVNAPDCIVAGVNACGEGVLYETWPMFRDTSAEDLRIALCSPAVNAGNNTAIDTTDIMTDIAGGIRKVGGIVDIGAYEQQYESIQALATVQNASSAGTADGSIVIDSFIGGFAPYAVLWENGDTVLLQEELAIGDYIITITDIDGCSFTDTLTVDFTNGLSDPNIGAFHLYPNPAKEVVYINSGLLDGSSCDFYLYDALGKTVIQEKIHSDSGTLKIHIGEDIKPGVYFYSFVMKGASVKTGKLVVVF